MQAPLVTQFAPIVADSHHVQLLAAQSVQFWYDVQDAVGQGLRMVLPVPTHEPL